MVDMMMNSPTPVMGDLLSYMKQQAQILEVDQIKIGLASPDMIRSQSFGEVLKSETYNYRTFSLFTK